MRFFPFGDFDGYKLSHFLAQFGRVVADTRLLALRITAHALWPPRTCRRLGIANFVIACGTTLRASIGVVLSGMKVFEIVFHRLAFTLEARGLCGKGLSINVDRDQPRRRFDPANGGVDIERVEFHTEGAATRAVCGQNRSA